MKTSTDFQINTYSFNDSITGVVENKSIAKDLWPIVYILTDDRISEAYVGETTDVVARMGAHLKNDKKKKLTVVNLITSDKFNKSATLDIESNLIKYLSGDGKYKLLNGNLGIAYHTYYQKNDVYWPLFTSIWDGLKTKGIASHSLEKIDNSDLFKYSPYKSLRHDQVKSLKIMLGAIADAGHNAMIMEGGAGTGKTILAVFLFKLLASDTNDLDFKTFGHEEQEFLELAEKIKSKYPKLKMGLVVPMTSFRSTLQSVFKNIKGLKSSMVISPADVTKQKFDILLVDESHRLRQRKSTGAYIGSFDKAARRLGLDPKETNELEWVLKQTDKAVLFYDHQQSIKPSDVPQKYFDELKKQSTTIVKQLTSQFRVLGGTDYVKFVDKLLKVELAPNENFISSDYDFRVFDSLSEMVAEIKNKNELEGLSRLIAGFSWDWISNKPGKSKLSDISINGTDLKWNGVTENWINSDNAENEVGCIHTTQGYDLNYAGIILGNEIGYDPIKQEIFIVKDNYKDTTGKQAKTLTELKNYILNIYKTMMLRGIKGTYLYACEPGLQAYLKNYVSTFGQIEQEELLDESESEQEVEIIPFVNAVPLYNLKAAAGEFSKEQKVEEMTWQLVPSRVSINKDYFACQVVGESMNKIIPNGSIALFKKYHGGSRDGLIVLAELTNYQDAENGSCYTVKEYRSKKIMTEESWAHTRIELRPNSSQIDFEVLRFESLEENSKLTIIGIFISVI